MGLGKSGIRERKSGNISGMCKDRGKVTMEGLLELSHALSNGTIPDPLLAQHSCSYYVFNRECKIRFRLLTAPGQMENNSGASRFFALHMQWEIQKK